MTQPNEHINIELSGIKNKTVNYAFEVYRIAVNHNVTGYIKKFNEQAFEIMAQGQPNKMEKFIKQLELLCKGMAHIHIDACKTDIQYHEFRIISDIRK